VEGPRRTPPNPSGRTAQRGRRRPDGGQNPAIQNLTSRRRGRGRKAQGRTNPCVPQAMPVRKKSGPRLAAGAHVEAPVYLVWRCVNVGSDSLTACGRKARGVQRLALRQAPKARSISAWGNAPGNKSAVPQKGCKPALYSIMERAFSPSILGEFVFLGRCPRLIWRGPSALQPLAHVAAVTQVVR